MAKQIIYGDETTKAIKTGVDKLANAVKVTLGPRGMYVVLEKKFGSPTITNDGVTIAKEIELEDANENIGAQLVREIASKTNDEAGDGTTTACVLAQALVNEGISVILFAEGSYNRRLEIIKDLPRAAAAWYFDQTDMAEAKRVLGKTSCIIGNVPTSLLMTGRPEEVKEHCRQLIETCGKGGGYILAGGANIDEGNADNLRAMMAAVKEYGVYKK